MKRPIFLLAFIAAALLLLTGCGGVRQLTRLEVDRVERFRIESLGVGTLEGTATVSLYNGNKKNVTFGSGRFELLLDGRTMGVLTLREPVVVAPGAGRAEVPIRIRFSQETLRRVAELFGRRDDTRKPSVWRLDGRIGLDRDEDGSAAGRRSTVRFRRRIDRETITRFGESLAGGSVGLLIR